MQPAPTATPYFENVVERWATSGIIQIDLACEWALLEKSSRELGNSRNQQQLIRLSGARISITCCHVTHSNQDPGVTGDPGGTDCAGGALSPIVTTSTSQRLNRPTAAPDGSGAAAEAGTAAPDGGGQVAEAGTAAPDGGAAAAEAGTAAPDGGGQMAEAGTASGCGGDKAVSRSIPHIDSFSDIC